MDQYPSPSVVHVSYFQSPLLEKRTVTAAILRVIRKASVPLPSDREVVGTDCISLENDVAGIVLTIDDCIQLMGYTTLVYYGVPISSLFPARWVTSHRS